MVKKIILLLMVCSMNQLAAQSDDPPVLDFNGLQPYLQQSNDTIYVVNFWATWCKPCLEELPYIEQIHKDKFDDPVKVILVSLDFRHQIQQKLIPFILEKDLKSTVVVLDDPDANTWIDKVDPRWSGALPATVIYRREKRVFIPDTFENYAAIKSIIDTF
jgi:thiol-disulfide isomerase/thioredoxin